MLGNGTVSDEVRRVRAMAVFFETAVTSRLELDVCTRDDKNCTAGQGLSYLIEEMIDDLGKIEEMAEELEGSKKESEASHDEA